MAIDQIISFAKSYVSQLSSSDLQSFNRLAFIAGFEFASNGFCAYGDCCELIAMVESMVQDSVASLAIAA